MDSWRTTEQVAVDVLVLGGGMAGHRAALSACRQGGSVGHAFMARGASSYMICANVPLGCVDPEDGVEPYAADMIRAGYQLNDRRLVRSLADNAIASFNDLVELGVPFVRTDNGYAQRLLAGNTYARGVYTSGRGMGPDIMDVLASRAEQLGVRVWNAHYVISLLREEDQVVGALLADYRTGQLTAVQARAVVLAMGGIGRLFEDSTYPSDVAADSYALALEAGAQLIDMEFVQFEPTVTVHPEGARGMEMPTAMLGDGARLINANGERFMFRHNPEHGERLVEKAIMSVYIQQEIDEGRGLPDGTIYFDTTTVPPEKLESYVSHCRRLRRAGLEPLREMPRIRPAAHSLMGGIRIDEHGWTGVPGLYACGEASAGVHGASRMAGNSGAETLVMGWVVGAAAARAAQNSAAASKPLPNAHHALEVIANGSDEGASTLKGSIRAVMSKAGGLFRTGAELESGLHELGDLETTASKLRASTIKQLVEARSARNMLTVGQVILRAALLRTESRGAHRRRDYPEQDDANWLKHIGFRRGESAEIVATVVPLE